MGRVMRAPAVLLVVATTLFRPVAPANFLGTVITSSTPRFRTATSGGGTGAAAVSRDGDEGGADEAAVDRTPVDLRLGFVLPGTSTKCAAQEAVVDVRLGLKTNGRAALPVGTVMAVTLPGFTGEGDRPRPAALPRVRPCTHGARPPAPPPRPQLAS